MIIVRGSNDLPDGSDPDYYRILARSVGYPFLEKIDQTPSNVTQRISKSDAERLMVFPVAAQDGRLTFAISDPNDFGVIDSLAHILNYPPNNFSFVVASPEQITSAIERHYT